MSGQAPHDFADHLSEDGTCDCMCERCVASYRTAEDEHICTCPDCDQTACGLHAATPVVPDVDLTLYEASSLNVIADAISSVQWTPLSVRYRMAAAVLDAQAAPLGGGT